VEVPESAIEAGLVDLENVPLSELENYSDTLLGPSLSTVLGQVDRPRKNIGTGPPGRVD
jgi:hypothetical protein